MAMPMKTTKTDTSCCQLKGSPETALRATRITEKVEAAGEATDTGPRAKALYRKSNAARLRNPERSETDQL